MSRDARDELGRLASGLRSEVRRQRRSGVRKTARCEPPTAELAPASEPDHEGQLPTKVLRPVGPGRAGAASADTARRVTDGEAEAVRERAAACGDLDQLRAGVAACTACGLSRTRTQTVFADGTGVARVMFVGEAPGANEDREGVPFVGRAGALLTDIVTKGMGLARQDVYIANVLKCRPPDNRDPSESEKRLCTPWLDRQIELVDPAVLIPVGRHAACHVLGVQSSMGALRGRVHALGGRKVVATYHPAYLLRSPGMKKECWKDIQLAMAELGLPPPGPTGDTER